ncbi:MAG: CRISPR-associated endonuclease Cas3'' [Candidatus Riflebacteria bacterium HGW-Riflebacteria-2]|nr:MAG: CRISPR-associated endonuclease Cas3'' [Candidatus Riflebacteria bacterium HGW-Riflebacteria-2]
MAIQTVEEHLREVSSIAGFFAAKFRLAKSGSLIGLVHDFGKFSDAFQNYIRACVSQEFSTGVFDFDIDDIEDAKSLKGKIDHSTAGAQFLNSSISQFEKAKFRELCAQILGLAVVSHHGGLIDCIDPDGHNKYAERISKSDDKTHYSECLSKLPAKIRSECESLINMDLIAELACCVKEIFVSNPASVVQPSNKVREFYLGCLARCLYSCLVDADRISSADFEDPQNQNARMNAATDWNVAIARFEGFIDKLGLTKPIDRIRRNISDQCRQRADEIQGIYSLTVPTGGGKTFASLRYALHHAAKHKLDRIVYVIPYTSIIEQNAQEIRKIFEFEGEDFSSWVLEHHSNLEAEQQTWQSKLLAENWDAPIVVTTMVQFLEAWFGSGTRSVRRLHQMANSVLIFDEVQTVPVRCVHMFCNALNFITMFGKSTALLCTATQPVLNELHKPDKGQLVLAANHELVGDKSRVEQLFAELKRVEILNRCKEPGWNLEELSE